MFLKNLKLIQKILKTWSPPPNIRPTVWAETFTNFDQSSAVRGKFRALGWQPAILDAFSPFVPQIRRIAVLKSARLGWTTILQLVIGYIIHCDPSNILVVQPTWDDVVGWGKENLENLFNDTPVLRNRMSKAGTKATRGGNTAKQKAFLGGVLYLIGAQSAAGFRRKTSKYVLMDELAGYGEPTVEGDQGLLAENRAASFHDAKIGAGSTPTNVGDRIDTRFNESDKGYYLLPCRDCGEFAMRAFKSPKYTMAPPIVRGNPVPMAYLDTERTADHDHPSGYECPFCGTVDPLQRHKGGMWWGETWSWTEADLYKFEPDFSGDIGFFIWSGYSVHPLAAPKHILREYNRVFDEPETLKVFVNTTLGCLWLEEGEDVDSTDLAPRREILVNTIPAGYNVLTCGVDVQGNRIEALYLAHGPNDTKTVVDYRVFWGDTSDHRDNCWLELRDSITTEQFDRTGGYPLQVAQTLVDTGYNIDAVYAFLKDTKAMYVRGCKGQPGRYPIVEDRTKREARLRKSKERQDVHRPELVGVDSAKLWWLRALKKEVGERRHVRFAHSLDDEFFDQLTAERLQRTKKRGTWVQEWIKIRERNEALDTAVYALAAFLLLNAKPENLSEQQIFRKNTRQAPSKCVRIPRQAGVNSEDAAGATMDNHTVPTIATPNAKTKRKARQTSRSDWDKYL